MTTPTFLILRPYGSGYSVVPTERDDAPIFHRRYIPLAPLPPFGTMDTGIKHEDYCACVCGFKLNDPGVWASALYMEKNMTSGFWDITWIFSGSSGPTVPPGPGYPSVFFDITFTAHGLCQVD